VQAAGEWLLDDTLHLVPTAWNAHMLAVFALNCAFVSLGTMVIYGWTRQGAAAGFAVLVALAIWQPSVLWVQTTGFLVQAERTGVRACVAQSWCQFLFTSQFICTPAQERAGVRYTFDAQRPQAGALLHFSTVWVTAGSAARGGTTPR
jgi:hypothetical protein